MPATNFEVQRRQILAEISATTSRVRGLIGKAALDRTSDEGDGRGPRHEFVPIELQPYANEPQLADVKWNLAYHAAATACGRTMLEGQAEQEMHVAAVGRPFRRRGSIGSPHLVHVPYVPSEIRFRAASICWIFIVSVCSMASSAGCAASCSKF